MRSRWEFEELNMIVIVDEDNLRFCELVYKGWWVGWRYIVVYWCLWRVMYFGIRWLIYVMRRICIVRNLLRLLGMIRIRYVGISRIFWYIWRMGIWGSFDGGCRIYYVIWWYRGIDMWRRSVGKEVLDIIFRDDLDEMVSFNMVYFNECWFKCNDIWVL